MPLNARLSLLQLSDDDILHVLTDLLGVPTLLGFRQVSTRRCPISIMRLNNHTGL